MKKILIIIILLISGASYSQVPLLNPDNGLPFTGENGEPIFSIKPQDIYPSNHILALDANHGITLNGASAVSQWDYADGLSGYASQSTGANQPQILYNQINGFPSVSTTYVPSGGTTLKATLNNSITASNNMTIICVGSFTSGGSYASLNILNNVGTGSILTVNANSNNTTYACSSLPTSNQQVLSPYITKSNWDAFIITINNNVGTSYVYQSAGTSLTISGTYATISQLGGIGGGAGGTFKIARLDVWNTCLPLSIINSLLINYYNPKYKLH